MCEDPAGCLGGGPVVGVGVDIEPVARWTAPDRRLFRQDEHAYCRSRADVAEAYAGTWAAKEAVVKAVFATRPLTPREVTVVRGPDGAPSVRLALTVDVRVHLSISHADGMAVAFAVASAPAAGARCGAGARIRRDAHGGVPG